MNFCLRLGTGHKKVTSPTSLGNSQLAPPPSILSQLVHALNSGRFTESSTRATRRSLPSSLQQTYRYRCLHPFPYRLEDPIRPSQYEPEHGIGPSNPIYLDLMGLEGPIALKPHRQSIGRVWVSENMFVSFRHVRWHTSEAPPFGGRVLRNGDMDGDQVNPKVANMLQIRANHGHCFDFGSGKKNTETIAGHHRVKIPGHHQGPHRGT